MRTASPAAMEIVKATAPALEKHGVEITTAMYARLLQDPEIAAMFDRAARSEERRVGKECRRLCRSRLSPYH
jgi:nitric oxide dioxygenase/hemoglobin